jgi:FkbM family methyltransferase
MISYAQNFEDVMLSRALRRVEAGFYIDVGAADPTIDSVTRAFYDAGWRGINIEPLPQHAAMLAQERPRDVNLGCAAGRHNGMLRLWETDVVGWATVRPDRIEQLIAGGHTGAYLSVETRMLADICAEYAPADIHFLKIDVEGFERDVLLGCDFSRFRPWIVVVEATRPNSSEEVHGEWEDILLSADYRFVYADGLNRFYLATEHADLTDAFRYPPNVFDRFKVRETVVAEASVLLAGQKAEEAAAWVASVSSEARAAVEAATAETRRVATDAGVRIGLAETAAALAAAEAARFRAEARLAEGQMRDAEARAIEASQRALAADAKAVEAQARSRDLESWAHWAEDRAARAEAATAIVEGQLSDLLGSKSWRMTRPLREARLQLRTLIQLFGIRTRRCIGMLAAFVVETAQRPTIRVGVRRMAERLGVETALRRLYRSIAAWRLAEDRSAVADGGSVDSEGYAPMTAHARAIHAVLRSPRPDAPDR